MNNVTKSNQVDCINLDFSKAFDKGNHHLLIGKLAEVCGSSLKWIYDLIVKCEGACLLSLCSALWSSSRLASQPNLILHFYY